MPILHKNITSSADIHNPKWFGDSDNGDYAWKNEQGVLETIDELLLPSALNFVDASVAPSTSNIGDIYVLSSGASVHADWGTVSVGDWVRYSGTEWNAITPQKSSLCYNENSDSLLSFNGVDWVAIGGGIQNVTTSQKSALTPVDGDFVYDTDEDSLQVYNGTTWINVAKGYGVAAAYNSDGEPTFFTTLKGAYSSGIGNVKLLADYEETSANQITITDGRHIDLNGFTYTYNVADGTSMFIDSFTNNSIRITNGRLIRKNGTGSDYVINCNLSQNSIEVLNVYAENENGACLHVKTNFNGTGSEFISNASTGNGFYFDSSCKVRFGRYINKGNADTTFNGDELKFVEFICEGGGKHTLNAEVFDSRFITNTGRAILTLSATKIFDCYVYSATSNAIDIRSNSEVYNCTLISDTGVVVNNNGNSDTKIINSTITQENSSATNIPIVSPKYLQDCNITGNGNSHGVYAYLPDTVISGNTVNLKNSTSKNAIFPQSAATNAIITNNRIFVNSSTDTGIRILNDAYISNNTIKGTSNILNLGANSNLWTAVKDGQGNSAQL